jgi:hypothetical protein
MSFNIIRHREDWAFTQFYSVSPVACWGSPLNEAPSTSFQYNIVVCDCILPFILAFRPQRAVDKALYSNQGSVKFLGIVTRTKPSIKRWDLPAVCYHSMMLNHRGFRKKMVGIFCPFPAFHERLRVRVTSVGGTFERVPRKREIWEIC